MSFKFIERDVFIIEAKVNVSNWKIKYEKKT